MKRLLLTITVVMALAAILLIAGCSKDDDNDSNSNNPTGSGSISNRMTAKVDGVDFSENAGASYFTPTNTLHIGGGGMGYPKIELVLPYDECAEGKSFSFGGVFTTQRSRAVCYTSISDDYHDHDEQNCGTVTLTLYNGSRAKGTFSVDLYKEDQYGNIDGQVSITEGTFDVEVIKGY